MIMVIHMVKTGDRRSPSTGWASHGVRCTPPVPTSPLSLLTPPQLMLLPPPPLLPLLLPPPLLPLLLLLLPRLLPLLPFKYTPMHTSRTPLLMLQPPDIRVST